MRAMHKSKSKFFAGCKPLLGLFIAASFALAHAADDLPVESTEASTAPLYYNGKADDWATPIGIVPPIYPSNALKQKLTGYVDMEISINLNGIVEEIRSLSPDPKNEDFEAAAKEAVMQWLFNVPTGKGCKPRAFLGIQRIWFDIKDGKPEITYSKIVQKQAEPKLRGINLKTADGKGVMDLVKYPSAARKQGVMGFFYVLFNVDPASGHTDEIEFSHSYTIPAGKEYLFKSTITGAFRKAEFEPIPSLKKKIAVCVPVSFTLRN